MNKLTRAACLRTNAAQPGEHRVTIYAYALRSNPGAMHLASSAPVTCLSVLILTSNKSYGQWAEIFVGDEVIAPASQLYVMVTVMVTFLFVESLFCKE